ncbi:Hypothetical predicted protein [Mytilus galloprovincialis]|uniref:Uncharacterized protein n=1 Tax=Mytilus galloprovincialis TaxID=29158 RepID=A0A8B6C133_MYTGA|nr:Hypothetical predicted protein [Mytilus galloprovincialis]
MAKCVRSFLKVPVAVLPVVNVIIFIVAIVMLIISLNPGVKWNEYLDEIAPGFYVYYFHTLWTSLDANAYEGKLGSGSYSKILNPHHDETWKSPIQNGIYQTIVVISVALLLLIVGIALHSVTKQKVFTIAVDIGAVGAGIAGGYFCLKAVKDYENGIYGAVAKRSRPYYFPEKENMEIGYNLAMYSAIMTIVASVLIIVYIGLYIPFGEGKWIWQKKTIILPDVEKSIPIETKTKNIPKKIGQQRKAKQTEGKMIEVKEYRSK